jgi:hypothetical protein
MLCREQKIELSAQKKPAVQTYCADREQSRLSAQPPTQLCRELQKWAQRRKVTAATAVGPAVGPTVRCAESPPMALGTEICAECLTKALGKELKKSNSRIQTFCFINLHPYKKHMLKFHIKIDIYFVFNNFISF